MISVKTSFFLIAALLIGEAYAQVLIKPGLPAFADTLAMPKNKSLRFIAMGDWGRNGDDHQLQVATQMTKTAKQANIDFVVSTGDNFYPSGVISEQDPLFHYAFEEIYKSFALQCDWYVVLGNHDYKSNPDAQVKYSGISCRWKMPARYFSKKFAIGGDTTQQVLIAFIDTNPLIPEFYSNSEYGPNVRNADSSAQKQWLNTVLGDTSKNIRWKIVVGHHPMYTGGSRTDGYDTKAIRNTLKPLLDKYNVDVYLTGHEHSLQHLAAGKTNHFISGGRQKKHPYTKYLRAKWWPANMVLCCLLFRPISCRCKQLAMPAKLFTAPPLIKINSCHFF